MRKPYLDTGEITGTHGVRGEIRVHPWSDSPQFLTKFKRLYLDADGASYIDVTKARVHGSMIIIKAKGIDDIPAAERLRGKVVYIRRKDAKLDEGTYFVQDLIGCKVYNADSGKYYGNVCDVSKTGANDVWHIEQGDKQVLIPVIDDVVISVDIDSERVEIRPLKGLFDDED